MYGARNIKKGRSLLCQRSRIKYGFIREQKETYPVTVLCSVMNVSTSAFYAWNQQPEISDKMKQREKFDAKVREIFEENKKVYGSRRISIALKEQGINAGRIKPGKPWRDVNWKSVIPRNLKSRRIVNIIIQFHPIYYSSHSTDLISIK